MVHRTALRFALLCLGAVLTLPRPARAALRAEQITADTVEALQIGGSDAVGGIGDWYLANDVVEIIVDDPSRHVGMLPHGGTIVDAGRLDRTDEDQFVAMLPVFNLNQRIYPWFDTIRAEVNEAEGWARLVVRGSRGMDSVPRGGWFARRFDPLVPPRGSLRGVVVETEYRVQLGEPYVHLTTTVHNAGGRPARLFNYSDIIIRGGRAMRAWLGHTLDLPRSRGFQHRSFDPGDILHAGEAIAPFTYAALPGVRGWPPVSYGLCAPDRVAAGRPSFGVTDAGLTGVSAFLFENDWQELSFWRLLRATRHRLAPGATWTYHRLFVVGDRPDVASQTDLVFPLLGFADGTSGVTGRVEPADVPHVILVTDGYTGAPVTEITTPVQGPNAGHYRAVLPPGNYALTVRAPQRPGTHVNAIVPLHEWVDAGVQRLAAPGHLICDPAFADGGPGRVIVQGEGDTPDPVFDPELLGFTVDGRAPTSGTETNSLYFLGNAHDPTEVAVPPGRYRLTATRSLEHGAATAVVTVEGPGRSTRVKPFTVPRVIDLADYVTADFHVHSQASEDSSMTNHSRVRTFVGESMDVLTTTDHDNLGHYDRALDELEVRDRLRVVQGAEVTGAAPTARAPWTVGHTNAWPLRYEPHAHGHGAPPNENMSRAELHLILRRDYGADVVQLNHPRATNPEDFDESDYLTHLGDAGVAHDPELPLTAAPNDRLLVPASDGHTRAIDFDTIEVMNGDSYRQYVRVRRDWYAFLKQGFRHTAVANSDSHAPAHLAGYPRNYVRFPPGLAGWDQAAFDAAIKAGRVFGTNGPLFVRFTVNGAGMGEDVAAPDGRVEVGVTVAAAPWVPVDEVRVVVNGEVRHTFADLPRLDGAPVIRLDEDLGLDLTEDAFITLEAGVPLSEDPTEIPPLPGGLYSKTIAPRTLPVAFTNPVFVDADGNGRFDPPGIPAPAKGWFMTIPLYVFGFVVVVMVAAVLIARRKA